MDMVKYCVVSETNASAVRKHCIAPGCIRVGEITAAGAVVWGKNQGRGVINQGKKYMQRFWGGRDFRKWLKASNYVVSGVSGTALLQGG